MSEDKEGGEKCEMKSMIDSPGMTEACETGEGDLFNTRKRKRDLSGSELSPVSIENGIMQISEETGYGSDVDMFDDSYEKPKTQTECLSEGLNLRIQESQQAAVRLKSELLEKIQTVEGKHREWEAKLKTEMTAKSEERRRVRERERVRLRGIPPPPAKTRPDLDIHGILDAWNSNAQLHLTGTLCAKIPKRIKTSPRKLITNTPLEARKAEDEGDPGFRGFHDDVDLARLDVGGLGADLGEVTEEMRGFDVYLNCDNEEDELLNQKLVEKMIFCETWSTFVRTPPSKLTAQRRWCYSPGKRLSHLAKRRQVFSHRPNFAPTTSFRTISIDKENKKKKKAEKPPNRALFQSPDKMLKSRQTSISDRPNGKRLKMMENLRGAAGASRPADANRRLKTDFISSRQKRLLELSGCSAGQDQVDF